jgi:ATP synthase delta (OSCP) subunit
MSTPQEILDLLLNTCFTSTEIRRRASLVKNFYAKLIYQNPKPRPQDFFTNPLDWQWFLTYQTLLYQTLNDPRTKSSLVELDSKINSIKTLTMFTAIPIPEDSLDSIAFKLRRVLDPHLILENRVDPDIIGGCILIKDGIVKDYSLRNKINGLKTNLKKNFQEAVPR